MPEDLGTILPPIPQDFWQFTTTRIDYGSFLTTIIILYLNQDSV